ncbi:MAG: AI-2E family transporter [Christensenellales bacterium]
MKKNNNENCKIRKTILTAALALLAVLLIYSAIGEPFSVLLRKTLVGLFTVLIAFAVAYLLNKSVIMTEKAMIAIGFRPMSKVTRVLSISVCLIFFIGSVALLLGITLPAVAGNLEKLISDIPLSRDSLESYFERLQELFPILKNVNFDEIAATAEEKVRSMLPELYSLLADVTVRLASGLGVAATVLLIAVFAVYEKENLTHYSGVILSDILGERRYFKTACALKCVDVICDGYFSGKLFESMVVGTLNVFLYLLFGVPYAAFASLVISVFYIIPYVGGYIALAPVALTIFLVSPAKALTAVIISVTVINVSGLFISPLILQSKLNVSPLCVIISVVIGGAVAGIIGVLLATPVAAILILFFNLFFFQKKSRKTTPTIDK